MIVYLKTVEKVYSKRDLDELRKISLSIMESKKDPEYRKAIKEFIKATT